MLKDENWTLKFYKQNVLTDDFHLWTPYLKKMFVWAFLDKGEDEDGKYLYPERPVKYREIVNQYLKGTKRNFDICLKKATFKDFIFYDRLQTQRKRDGLSL